MSVTITFIFISWNLLSLKTEYLSRITKIFFKKEPFMNRLDSFVWLRRKMYTSNYTTTQSSCLSRPPVCSFLLKPAEERPNVADERPQPGLLGRIEDCVAFYHWAKVSPIWSDVSFLCPALQREEKKENFSQ